MKLGFKRLVAFLLDCIILFFALTVVNLFVPTFGDIDNLSNRTLEIVEDYANGEITKDKFKEESNDINYELSKVSYLSTIAGIVIYILYFVVFQAYNNGQTLGKKVFRLQVLKTNDELPDINCLTKRCLIPYGILVNFILVVLILFVSKNTYLAINTILSNIHMCVIVATIVTMFIKNRGIHDYLSNTKVEEI